MIDGETLDGGGMDQNITTIRESLNKIEADRYKAPHTHHLY
jgi:hypothetical protein